MNPRYTKEEIIKAFNITEREFEQLKGNKKLIHKQFKKIIWNFHPDTDPNDPTLTAKFQYYKNLEDVFAKWPSEANQSYSNNSYENTDCYGEHKDQEPHWEKGEFYYSSELEKNIRDKVLNFSLEFLRVLSLPVRGALYLVTFIIGLVITLYITLWSLFAGLGYAATIIYIIYMIVTKTGDVKHYLMGIGLLISTYFVTIVLGKLSEWLREYGTDILRGFFFYWEMHK